MKIRYTMNFRLSQPIVGNKQAIIIALDTEYNFKKMSKNPTLVPESME